MLNSNKKLLSSQNPNMDELKFMSTYGASWIFKTNNGSITDEGNKNIYFWKYKNLISN